MTSESPDQINKARGLDTRFPGRSLPVVEAAIRAAADNGIIDVVKVRASLPDDRFSDEGIRSDRGDVTIYLAPPLGQVVTDPDRLSETLNGIAPNHPNRDISTPLRRGWWDKKGFVGFERVYYHDKFPGIKGSSVPESWRRVIVKMYPSREYAEVISEYEKACAYGPDTIYSNNKLESLANGLTPGEQARLSADPAGFIRQMRRTLAEAKRQRAFPS